MKWLGDIIGSAIFGPLVRGAVEAHKNSLDAGNTRENIAAELAGRELAVQQRETEVQAEYKRSLIGHWYEPTNLFGYIMVIYFGKSIVWDKVLGWGVTDGLTGQTAEWAGWIMMFYVGKRGIENVAAILKPRART